MTEKTAMQGPVNFTQLLSEWRSGHPQALERLTPLVYDELRRLARNYMRGGTQQRIHCRRRPWFTRLFCGSCKPMWRCRIAHTFLRWLRGSCAVYWWIMQSRGLRIKRNDLAFASSDTEETGPPIGQRTSM
jgi:hypothetical protein